MIAGGNAGAERLGLVRRPFELAVELARGGEDRQLAHAFAESSFVAQEVIDRPRDLRELGAVKLNPGGPLEPGDRPALGIGHAVVDLLSRRIEIGALGQRQPEPRFRVDVGGRMIGWHGGFLARGVPPILDRNGIERQASAGRAQR